MRTIKFRGRHLCGQWYYGNLIIRETDSPVPETTQSYKCVMIGDVEDGSAEEVEKETVGQFTGLLDKNGNEIYEGDYIEVHKSSFGGVVTWHPHGYFYIKELYKFKYDEEPDCLPLGEFIEDTKCKVTIIDNIHDNPELLNN